MGVTAFAYAQDKIPATPPVSTVPQEPAAKKEAVEEKKAETVKVTVVLAAGKG